jgi:hypothetical protein
VVENTICGMKQSLMIEPEVAEVVGRDEPSAPGARLVEVDLHREAFVAERAGCRAFDVDEVPGHVAGLEGMARSLAMASFELSSQVIVTPVSAA